MNDDPMVLEGDEFEQRVIRLLRRRLRGMFDQRRPVGLFIACAMYKRYKSPTDLTTIADGDLLEALEAYADDLTGERA